MHLALNKNKTIKVAGHTTIAHQLSSMLKDYYVRYCILKLLAQESILFLSHLGSWADDYDTNIFLQNSTLQNEDKKWPHTQLL